MHALIVEDEITTRVLLRRILTREFGCDVTECQNGLEALELLSRERVDFVVLDLRMPVLDGVETLEAIRRSPGHGSLPVVVMTVERDEGRVRRVIELGIDDYLLKPLRPDNVSDRLRQLMAKVADARTAEAATRRGAGGDAPPRLLVADGDAVWRQFVAATADGWQVVDAESGVAALKKAIELKPQAMLVGQDLGLVDAALLMKKLRAGEPFKGIRLLALVREGAGGDVPPGADGVVERSDDADLLRARLAAALPRVGAPQGPIDDIAAAVLAALEQFFGMMLSMPVEADPEATGTAAGSRASRVELTVGGESLQLALVLSGNDPAARATAGVVLDITATEVSDDDLALALAELAKLVASRVKTDVEARGLRLTTGRAMPIDTLPPGAPRRTLALRTTDGALRCRVDLFESAGDDARQAETIPALP